jgi:hypothetical protein
VEKWVEIVDQDGTSSLLSLVKAFDSVLDIYEGFCNLKQVQFLYYWVLFYLFMEFCYNIISLLLNDVGTKN